MFFDDYQKQPSRGVLRHGYSPVNLLHIFRTHFSKNTSGRLPLDHQGRELSNMSNLLWRFCVFTWDRETVSQNRESHGETMRLDIIGLDIMTTKFCLQRKISTKSTFLFQTFYNLFCRHQDEVSFDTLKTSKIRLFQKCFSYNLNSNRFFHILIQRQWSLCSEGCFILLLHFLDSSL